MEREAEQAGISAPPLTLYQPEQLYFHQFLLCLCLGGRGISHVSKPFLQIKSYPPRNKPQSLLLHLYTPPSQDTFILTCFYQYKSLAHNEFFFFLRHLSEIRLFECGNNCETTTGFNFYVNDARSHIRSKL